MNDTCSEEIIFPQDWHCEACGKAFKFPASHKKEIPDFGHPRHLKGDSVFGAKREICGRIVPDEDTA